jgi:branched-chain amino acid transport system substrate-binding protein
MPLTGKIANYGLLPLNGASLYIDEVNKNGGICGKKVSIINYDDAADAAKSVAGFDYLCDRNSVGIITGASSNVSLAVIQASQGSDVPIMLTTASSESLTYDKGSNSVYDNVFRTCFVDSFQGKKMASFAKEKLGAKTAAILYSPEDDYSSNLTAAFKNECKNLNIDVVSVEGFSSDAVDFQGQLTNIAAKKPDCLFIPTYYEKVALIAPQARKNGVDCTFLGADGWGSVTQTMDDAGSIEGSYYCSAYSKELDNNIARNFFDAYVQNFSLEPNMFSASGYDAAKILLTAVKNTMENGVDLNSSEFNQMLLKSIKNGEFECVTGDISFDEHNNSKKTAIIIKVSDGTEQFWGKY